RARGMAPWSGESEVLAAARAQLRAVLRAGAACAGLVVDDQGTPVPGAEVSIGDRSELASSRGRTAADGRFSLDGLPAGELEVTARAEDKGQASARLVGVAGTTASCELQLSRGLVLRGRVQFAEDQPLAGAIVRATLDTGEPGPDPRVWSASTVTDAAGRFSLGNCPDGALLRVAVLSRTSEPIDLRDVDPRRGELDLRAAPAGAKTVRSPGT